MQVYSIGQRVRVKAYLRTTGGLCGTIEGKAHDSNRCKVYAVRMDDGERRFFWPQMLEPDTREESQ